MNDPKEENNFHAKFRHYSFPTYLQNDKDNKNETCPRTPSPRPLVHNFSTDNDQGLITPPNSNQKVDTSNDFFNRNFSTSTSSSVNYKHRKSNAIYVPNDIDNLNLNLSLLQNQSFTDSTNSTNFKHQLSPKLTIDNTNEQIRRNSIGKFNSLMEFAQQNHIDINGKSFVDEPQAPKINLDI